MTGAMYAAIAGLKTHMQNLNVIGNNVANINTYSYKAGRSVFQTAIYTAHRRLQRHRHCGWPEPLSDRLRRQHGFGGRGHGQRELRRHRQPH